MAAVEVFRRRLNLPAGYVAGGTGARLTGKVELVVYSGVADNEVVKVLENFVTCIVSGFGTSNTVPTFAAAGDSRTVGWTASTVNSIQIFDPPSGATDRVTILSFA